MKSALVVAVVALALYGCRWLNRADPADPSLEVGYAWRVENPAGRPSAAAKPPGDPGAPGPGGSGGADPVGREHADDLAGPARQESAGGGAEPDGGGDVQRPDDRPRRLRVVTFNVYGASSRDIARAFQRDPALSRADIIFFQEIETRDSDILSRPAEVARALDMTYAYAPGYGLGERGSHGVAILARIRLDDFAIIELPRVWVHVNSARRVALAATARIGERGVRLYTTHLDNRQNPGQRIGQIAPVFDDIDRHIAEVEDLPVVLGGDLNTSPFCWITHLIPIPCGLQTSRLEAYARQRGMDTPVTASGATSEWLGMRLDGLYTRGLEVVDFDVAREVRVSDHLPLWMDIEL